MILTEQEYKEAQTLLIEYLVYKNAPRITILAIVGMLWQVGAIMEMFDYIVDNQSADYLQLYKMSLKIAQKYNTEEIENEQERLLMEWGKQAEAMEQTTPANQPR